MRILLFGATVVTAFLLPVGQAAAQCCGGATSAAPAAGVHDHAAGAQDHAAHAPATPSQAPATKAGCCGTHTMAPAPSAAAAATPSPKVGCCASHGMAAPTQAAAVAPAAPNGCCNHGNAAVPADDPAIALAGLGLVAPPAVRYLDAVFRDPVRVAGAVLMGNYVIEHDDERMARGEPCTYIYEADNLTAPVVTFHCEHLDGAPGDTATVTLGHTMNPAIKTLTAFQFAGETASHGVPVR